MPSYHRQDSLGNLAVYFPVLQQALQQGQVIHRNVDCMRSRQPSRCTDKCSEEHNSMELFDELFSQPERPSQHQELGVIDDLQQERHIRYQLYHEYEN